MKDGYYTSGEFAKKANVTLRTIRFYDKKGLLKPSKVAHNGYRLYTDEDFLKLQKILSLKYMGFSLEEIMTMTIDDGKQGMKESVELQLYLVRKKMEHFAMVEASLKDMARTLDHKEEIDWNRVMELLRVTNMERTLVEQYRNANNLDIRIGLHQECSKNPVSWFDWIYSKLPLREHETILELGCGTGELWKNHLHQLPEDTTLILSDQSQGMIADTKAFLACDWIKYRQIDCEHIPMEDRQVDLAIANHVLFYVKDRPRAFQEVHRILMDKGVFVCSTYGSHHMQEITNLVKEFDSRITLSGNALYEEFGLENGKEQLEPYFSKVEMVTYDDALLVTRWEPLIAYILSCHGNQHDYIDHRYEEFKHFIQQKMERQKPLTITKEAGIYLCYK